MKQIFIYLVSLTLLFAIQNTHAQGKSIEVTGTVIDVETNAPLEYATLVLQPQDSEKEISGGITDANGKFKVQVSPGVYDIRVEFISYTTYTSDGRNLSADTDLGTIGLNVDVGQLEEVEVVGEKTTVEVRLDKKIYNIGKDLTTSGANVSDALNNVPSVTVDVDGVISLRGNENVRILINGKPSAMAGYGSNDALRQLPADAIESVEVITSPSARYDAEGTAGILNIVLKKQKTLGFNGTVNATVGYPISSQVTTNLNLRTDKVNVFGTLGYFYREPPGNAFFDNTYASGDFSRIIEDRDTQREEQGLNATLGTEYFINDKSSITGSIFSNISDEFETTENYSQRFIDGLYDSQTLRTEDGDKDKKSYQTSLNYTNNINEEGHKLTADFQYSFDDETVLTAFDENIVLPEEEPVSQEIVSETEERNEFLVQADYVLPMGDAQFEAGYRGNFKTDATDYRLDTLNLDTGLFEINEDLTNRFDYTENINALYTQYGNKFGKFSFLLGLRLENTQLKGEATSDFDLDALEELLGSEVALNFDKNYLGLFPTVNLIYELAEEENITLGYNRRINRPRGFFINPFPSRSSTINIFQGNPNLDPAYASAFDLGYLKRWEKMTLTSSLYYQRETDSYEVVQEETGETTSQGIFIIRSIPINLSTNERYGAELGLLYNPARWLRLNGSFNYFKFVTDGIYNGVNYGAENTSWFARFSSKVTLPGKIDWQVNANYRGPRQNSQTEYEGIFFMDMAFSKDILGENATVSLNARDLLNSRKRILATDTDFFTSEGELQRRQREITLSLVYRINQEKERRKRERQNSTEPEEGEY